MAQDSGPESPLPVRTVSQMIGEWIGRLGAVWIEGQVADFKERPRARVQFLSLRDLEANVSVSVVADADLLARMEPPLEIGQRVVVWAKPEFWSGRGTLQLRARTIKSVGIGELLARLAQLQATLAAEGLFAPERKQPLPFLPRRIGLICGRGSDAEHDVVVNARDRWPAAEFDIREVAVQGVNAVREVTDALVELDADPLIDVIVITRGGGSVEDLLPFSNESLVRAVSTAQTPIVSAIGHEQDNPILDHVADYRASTPTDAGKRIVPSFIEQDALVSGLLTRGRSAIQRRLDTEATWIDDARRRTERSLHNRIQTLSADVDHLLARARGLSPMATLERGYAVVQRADGSVVRNPSEVEAKEELEVRVQRGSLTVEVTARSQEAE
ncbi:MAG TPA: exodeoxyribonuclease VII large subunit [Candidatus Nanopelagicales bacterium]|nr:exodeoxyribonuclease VII large subunit [Candidatus Nanopelagicales bacterium]